MWNLALVLIFIAGFTLPAHAGMAEAKDLARGYNCTVTAIKLIAQDTGSHGASIYEAGCALPAEATAEEKKANGKLTIACDSGLCTLRKKGE